MSIYLDTEDEGSLIIDASISHQLGSPIASKYAAEVHEGQRTPLKVDILSGSKLLKSATIILGSTDNEISIRLDGFSASTQPHQITVKATLSSGGVGAAYTASTNLYRLPYPKNYGTISRIDNLFGGLWYQKGKQAPWQSIFPYTYYGNVVFRTYRLQQQQLTAPSTMEPILGQQRHHVGRICRHGLQPDPHCAHWHTG
jgi:hypothetical protein